MWLKCIRFDLLNRNSNLKAGNINVLLAQHFHICAEFFLSQNVLLEFVNFINKLRKENFVEFVIDVKVKRKLSFFMREIYYVRG